MSDLTAAVEAAARVFADTYDREISSTRPFGYEYGVPFVSTEADDWPSAIAAMAAAAPLIEAAARADERAKVAEGIAEAITLNVRNPNFTKQDRGGFVGFTECMAYVAGHDKAAAIARQHANGMPSANAAGRTGANAKGGMPESAEGATAGFGTPDTNNTHKEN